MKRAVLLVICLLTLLLTGCQQTPKIEIIKPQEDTPIQSQTPLPNTQPSVSPEPLDLPSPTPKDTPGAEPVATPTPEPSPIGMSPNPTNTAEFYSSYANMVSFDPARGWAEFDYFDMLTGDDAVEWLVGEEGYTRADAEARVNDFADSEFIHKNTNHMLRTIDLKDVPLKLMFHDDGTMLTGAEPITSDVSDVFALYHLDESLLFDTFFFYIHVNADGEVTLVEQMYWP